MKKMCVYTCITGNYDNIIELTNKESQFDYICFTNNKNLKSKTWNIKYIEEDLDNLTLARKVKILGYKYLNEYELLIWIDGSISMLKPVSEFLRDCCDLKKYDMVGFKHKFRDCIYDEINECVRMNKESIENAKKIEKFLLNNKYPKHNGLIESGILVRKNNDSVNHLMDLWFDMINDYSKRDQLSFNYCLWKNEIKIDLLNMSVFDNDYFKVENHKSINKSNKYRIIFDENNVFNYKYVIDSKFKIHNDEVKICHKCIRDTNYIVLELYDEIGSSIYNIKLNNESNYNIFNFCDLGDKNYFYDKPIIMFKGNFKNGDKIVISFTLVRNTLNDLVLELNKKSGKIIDMLDKEREYISDANSLKNEIDSLNIEYNKIINSKSWKITKPLRVVSSKIKK